MMDVVVDVVEMVVVVVVVDVMMVVVDVVDVVVLVVVEVGVMVGGAGLGTRLNLYCTNCIKPSLAY